MQTRIANMRKLFEPLKVDGMVITNGFNMNYLTGFTGGAGDGLVVVGPEKIALITDDRYETEYRESLEAAGIELLITRNYWAVAMAVAKRFKIGRLGFEDTIAFRDFDFIDENFDGVDIVPVPRLLEMIREVKDGAEITALRRSADVAVSAFNELVDELHVGMTEREVANLLDQKMKARGADAPSFETIVASGSRSALPHGTYTDKVIEAGELVTIDFGYYVDGYTSDVTRTLAFGALSEEAQKIYETTRQAQVAAVAAVTPGMSAPALDAAARDVIEAAGYGEYYNHATGHGIGLDVHEGPVVSERTDASEKLVAGMVLTLEPGIYMPEIGGVRIEDEVLITADGVENLTAGITTDLITIEK